VNDTLELALVLSGYGLLTVFAALISFALLVKLLLRCLPERGPNAGPRP